MLGRKDFIACWSAGGKDDQRFDACTSAAFKGLARVRLATRGEALRYPADVYRVAGWIRENPSTKFWIPTRAIYIPGTANLNLDMVNLIEDQIMGLDNARVMASVDPYTAHNFNTLIRRGWNTMYFETQAVPAGYVKGLHPAASFKRSNVVYCKKTWDLYLDSRGRILHPHGVCRTCNRGCFQSDRVDVYLKNHYKAASHADLPGGANGRPICK
jgi:hypothetical protein